MTYYFLFKWQNVTDKVYWPVEGWSDGGSCLLIYGHWESLHRLRDFWSGFLHIKEGVEENKPTEGG